MLKHILALVAVVALAGSVGFVQASGGSSSGGGGGGGTGGGATVRYAGIVTGIVDAPEGVYVTIGTGYYNTGTLLVVPNTKIAYYSGASATVEDIDLGDYVEMNVTSAHVAVKATIVTP